MIAARTKLARMTEIGRRQTGRGVKLVASGTAISRAFGV